MTAVRGESFLADRRFLFTFAIIIAAIVIFHRLGQQLLAGDDTYYSEIAKEMTVTRDYLTLHHSFVPDFRTSKPPMLFWMNAVSGRLFGFNSFGMRLPSAVLCFLGVAAVLFFVNRYWNSYAAFMAALILTFTQQYLYHARSAVTDGPFAVFFAFALMSFWIAREEDRTPFYYLFGLFLGCAVMTRQVAGLFLLPVIAAFIVAVREYRILRNPHFYFAVLLSAVIVVPWHVVMYLRHGMAFIRQYFGVTLLTGIYGYPASYSANPSLNPRYAYLSILWSNYWPWLPFLIAGVYQSIKKYRAFPEPRRKFILYVFLWAAVPLLIFQAAKVKQYHYINPLYVPFAVFSAIAFDGFKERARREAAEWLAGIAAFLALVYLAVPVIPHTLDSREFVDTVKMLPEVRRIHDDLNTSEKAFNHFNSFFWFYADRGAVKNSEEELVRKIASKQRNYFVLYKDVFARVSRAGHAPLKIIRETDDAVLFSNR